MSVSLESVMRDAMSDARKVPPGAALLSFVLIALAAAFGFVLLSELILDFKTGLPAWMAGVLSYLVFLVPAYFAHRRYSFRARVPHAKAIPIYFGIQASGIVLAVLFSYAAYGVADLPSAPAALAVLALTSGVNFVFLRALAFSHR